MEKRRVGACRVSKARAGRTHGAETNKEQRGWCFGGTQKHRLGGALGRGVGWGERGAFCVRRALHPTGGAQFS